jgi:hypothetical protein
MKREDLPPEDREEYDALMADAGLTVEGLMRPSGEIGPRMHRLLQAAQVKGQIWAGWVLADDAENGHLAHWKQWNNRDKHQRVVTPAGDIVKRRAVHGIKRRRNDGTTYYQQGFWREMDWEEVEYKLAEATSQARAADITAATARRLLDLRKRVPESKGPAAACLMLRLDLDAYLAGEQNIA